MMIQENFPLKKYNTFGIDAFARYYVEIEKEEQLDELTDSKIFNNNPFFILGGGSNVLFRNNYQGIIIRSKLNSIEIIWEDADSILVKVGSGLPWDDFVAWSVMKNFGGAENLSDIPGNVGAAPVQNIGAYGTEAKDIIQSVDAYSLRERKSILFENAACKFNYRWSIFKEESHTDYFIKNVVFRLTKNPVLNTSYGKIEEELLKFGEKSVKSLRQAIINIRRSKLPSTDELGSAGSFFKNPFIEAAAAEKILQLYPTMPHYAENGCVKIPAAWLIEKSGLKGYRTGNVGTFIQQPLVIVNYGNATGLEIAELSEFIRNTVSKKFGILLEPEVCFI